MRFVPVAIGLLGLVATSTARSASNVEVLEKLATVPQGWSQGPAPSTSKLMKFRIAVHQQRAAEFEQRVIDMSTPGHASYGKHMSKYEMKEFLRPAAEVSEAILNWLRSEQVDEDSIEDDGDWISFIVPVGQAERMLDAHFYTYRHTETDVTRIRTLEYSIPTELHGLVQMIQPTTKFGTFRPQKSLVFDVNEVEEERLLSAATSAAYDPVFCNTTITPDCLRGLYGVGNYTIPTTSTISTPLGITGYLEELGRYADFNRFKAQFAPYLTTNFSVVSVNNGTIDQNSSSDSGEANLDVQYATALAASAPAIFYSTGGRGQLIPDLDQPDPAGNSNEPYLDLLNYLVNLPDAMLPKVLSTSYGEDEQSVPAAYANSTCSLYAQLGSRGVSVIHSSGDTGVGSACQTNDGRNTTRFLPIFPATCPFVTSVGATYHVEPERAISFSSGGFSDLWTRPTYQEAAVSAYLEQLGSKWEGLYNPAGRGFPDIAAQGYNYSVYDKGRLAKIGGTSASAPTIASIIVSLNSVRGSPLGFLNPWLYSTGYQGLTDIVDGGSSGCTGRDIYSGLPAPFVPYASWNATPGWDPVTGYGTPNFPNLVALLP